MYPIDQVELAFDAASLRTLNIIVALIMFGVALDLKVSDFVALVKNPKAPAIGLLTQFLVLPAACFGLITLLGPGPSVALGMLLVACCPGGNISNFITHIGGGRTSVSVGMTAVSSFAAVVATPANLGFWASWDPGMADLLTSFSLDPADMLTTVALILGLPVAAGMAAAAWLPGLARVLRKPSKTLSIGFLVLFIVVAFRNNFEHLVTHFGTVFLPVALLNGVALALGYGLALAGRLPKEDRRAVCIEVGIQNTPLALVLVFNFFNGLGGMAMIAAWWGIWHIVLGLTLATVWTRLDRRASADAGTST